MNENREVIIPDVLGVLSFIAKEINSIQMIMTWLKE